MSRPLDIGLLWHSDRSGNLGVGALTIGNIAIARGVLAEVGLSARFVIMGFGDARASYIADSDVRFMGLGTRAVPAFLTAVGRLDCALDIGGGDSFTDIYPIKRWSWIVMTKVAAILRGVPIVFSPQTIGPFEGRTSRKRLLNRVAVWTMRRARAVAVRDRKSFNAVREISDVEPVYSVDVAFALPWTAPPPHHGTRIGLNVSGLLWNGGHTGKNEFGLGYDYKVVMTGVIEALLERGDATVELICHVNGEPGSSEDDGGVADVLFARYPTLVRVPDFASPSDAKSHIAGLDALVGARMHATIAAFSSGVPVIPVSYSRKFEGLFGSLGYDWLVPHVGMETPEAIQFILDALDRRTELKSDVDRGLGQVKARLDAYRDVLRALFTGLMVPGEGVRDTTLLMGEGARAGS